MAIRKKQDKADVCCQLSYAAAQTTFMPVTTHIPYVWVCKSAGF